MTPFRLQVTSGLTVAIPLAACNWYSGVMSTPRSGCPINQSVEILGDRWTLVVLRDMIFGDARHFSALHRNSLEGIATNVQIGRASCRETRRTQGWHETVV